MVAKGHDFPDVTLGVVLDADSTLRFPDFRAEERTFALVAQLAGRSGRGERGGRVIVQALDPDAARAAPRRRRTTPSGFLAGELPRREALRYPPYGHLIRVVCSARRAGSRARGRHGGRELIADAGVRCSGRRRCSASRVATARSWSWRSARARRRRSRAVRQAVEAVAADQRAPGASYAVDVDPQ